MCSARVGRRPTAPRQCRRGATPLGARPRLDTAATHERPQQTAMPACPIPDSSSRRDRAVRRSRRDADARASCPVRHRVIRRRLPSTRGGGHPTRRTRVSFRPCEPVDAVGDDRGALRHGGPRPGRCQAPAPTRVGSLGIGDVGAHVSPAQRHRKDLRSGDDGAFDPAREGADRRSRCHARMPPHPREEANPFVPLTRRAETQEPVLVLLAACLEPRDTTSSGSRNTCWRISCRAITSRPIRPSAMPTRRPLQVGMPSVRAAAGLAARTGVSPA
jgi:hypothetical protein